MKKTLVFSLLVVALGANAAEQSASVTVSGQVSNSCTINSGGNLDFGAMANAENKTVASTLSVTCNNGAAYTIKPHDAASVSVTGQLNGSAMSNTETIAGQSQIPVGIGTLSFFKDSAASVAWSDAAPISASGNGSAQSHDVSARFVHDGTNYGNFTLTLRPTVVF